MERIYIFITCCIAGIIGTAVSMIFGLHWSCMVGTIIFVVAIALSLDVYFRERREKDELMYEELTGKEKALSEFIRVFGVDRPRAEQLYNAGFKKLDDFRNISIKELMQIGDINPTQAKRIVQKIAEI